MKEIAYFMLPLGAVTAALLSVPCQGLQRSCIGICNIRVSMGRYFSLRLCTAFLLYNLFRFVFVCMKLAGGTSAFWSRVVNTFPSLSSFRFFSQLRQSPATAAAGSAASAAALLGGNNRHQPGLTAPTAGYFPVQPEQENQLLALYDIRVQARTLRYQRDFWITLFAALLWLFVSWAAFLIRSYWRALDNARSSYEEVLQERRRLESVAAAKAATKAAHAATAAVPSVKQKQPERRQLQEKVTGTAVPEISETSSEKAEEKTDERRKQENKKERNKMEVEMTRMSAKLKEGEVEETATSAEDGESETPPSGLARRRRKVPANGSGIAVCRDEIWTDT